MNFRLEISPSLVINKENKNHRERLIYLKRLEWPKCKLLQDKKMEPRGVEPLTS